MATKASLRSFQDEIESIHQNETAKHRAQVHHPVDGESSKKPTVFKDTRNERKAEISPTDNATVNPVEYDEFDDAELQVYHKL